MTRRWSFIAFGLIALMAFGGCAKKISDDAAKAGSGFEDLSSTADEMAQLPQAPAADKQAVEPLPVEAAPVTQPVAQGSALNDAGSDVAGAGATIQATAKMSKDQKIQEALKVAGLYQGAVDGKIGPASKRAIEQFQKNNGLKADGKVGPKTWAALEKVLATGSAGAAATTAEAVPAQ
ncbi:MAG: peptidoglycan-binding domain-containing protein [Candidatus Omnitrophota bacterium]